MPDDVKTETKEKKPVLPPLPTQTVVRNDEAVDLKTFQIVKGKNEGVQYLAPEVTIGNFEQIVKWVGNANMVNIVQVYLKRAFWSIWWGALGKDGKINMELFLKECEDFTAASMKLAEIRKKIDELQAQLTSLLDVGNIGTNPDGTPTDDLVQVKAWGAEIRGYRDMEEKRSRPKDDDKGEADDEPAIRTN